MGRCFVARDEQVLSLPLREEARSGRQVGAILGARSLGGAFVDYGSELFLLGLGGLLGPAGTAVAASGAGSRGAAAGQAPGPGYVRPLDGLEYGLYERLLASGLPGAQGPAEAEPAAAGGISGKLLEGYAGLSGLSGAELESFVAAEWAGLQRQGNVFSELPRTSSYYHRGGVAGTVLHEDGSRAAPEPPAGPWWHG